MIRPMTAFSMVLAIALGVGLYRVKHEVRALEDERLKIERQITADEEGIHVLRAEWSFLTQPARLNQLAQRHLSLVPVTAPMIGRIDTIPLKGEPAAPATGVPPANAPVALAQTAPPPQTAPAAIVPAHAAAPVKLAAAKTAPAIVLRGADKPGNAPEVGQILQAMQAEGTRRPVAVALQTGAASDPKARVVQ